MKRTLMLTRWDDLPILLDLPLAARVLGVTGETLKRQAQSGTFPAIKCGKCWRISKRSLREYVGDEKEAR